MITRVKRWLAPPVFENEDQTRTAYLLNFIFLIFMGFLTVLGIALIALFQSVDFRALTALIAALIILGLYSLMRVGYVRLTAISFVSLIMLLGIVATVVVDGSVRSPGIYIFVMMGLAAALLVGVRFAGLIVAVFIVYAVGLVYAETTGLTVDNSQEVPIIGVAVIQITAVLLLTGLSYLHTQQLNTTLSLSRQNEHDLAQANKELADIRQTLEARISARTQGLELVNALSERLTGILNLDQLLIELVEQVKAGFEYYHVHIYLIDVERQDLVMTAGVGEAGAQMKADGHHISLNTTASLVSRAAHTGQIVNVPDVSQNPDWLPNKLLPDTKAEMAVPILVEGQVVGVLDVQHDLVAGLNDQDATLLRSLANQAAVAIRNAGLFEQIETALDDVQAVQSRYLAQAWEGRASNVQQSSKLDTRLGSPQLNQAIIEKAEQLSLNQDRAAIIRLEDEGADSIVAPVKLSNHQIGALQIHQAVDADDGVNWTQQDLNLIEAVLDQVALSAENLRLFDETRDLAAFERMANEITEKMRRAPTLEILVETAAIELGKALDVGYSNVTIAPQLDSPFSEDVSSETEVPL
ncbi:MAG: GAF domain-containing protein [Chloroflexota bacterium]